MKYHGNAEKILKENFLLHGEELYHPGFSVDSVIFGFHNNELKVLLIQMKHVDSWGLPGGFVLKDEDVDKAAYRILQSRTGVTDVFLRQFHLFGEVRRNNTIFNANILRHEGIAYDENHWFLQRFITVGYYALVNFIEVNPHSDKLSKACQWWDMNDLPSLMLDHEAIIQKALEALRLQLSYLPIGYNLLPDEFTMPELQKLYETILGKTLDRRNFQRKMLAFDILDKIGYKRQGGAHKAPYLYKFNLERYQKLLESGAQGSW